MNTLSQQQPIEHYILIVEDDQDDQMLLRIAFEQTTENFSLHFVCTANEALDFLHHAPDHSLPDLIVTDYHLPKINGLKLIQQLNSMERYQRIVKVILSNTCNFPKSGIKKAEFYKCFVKPHSIEGMKQLADDLLQLCIKKMHMQD
jgi:CheY-like chemotaxis protein